MERPEAHGCRPALSNPLLSSAVTGVCLQDLTHHAVLLPATRTSDPLNRIPQLTPSSDTEIPTDSSSNLVDTYKITVHSNIVSSQKEEIQKSKTNAETTEPKPFTRSKDDFDVNEYFARLQGTRYVSAPVNSGIEDKNANIVEAEENLEEINLRDDSRSSSSPVVEIKNSLTADIAQNFSQLPQRLPQVASAVFNSFSSILNLNRSKECISDPYTQNYGEYSRGYGVPEVVSADESQIEFPQKVQQGHQLSHYGNANPVGYEHDIAAHEHPPNEDVGWVQNIPMFAPNVVQVTKADERPLAGPPHVEGSDKMYRMASKKKTYAQIPGLCTGPSQAMPPTNPCGFNIPPVVTNDLPIEANLPPNIANIGGNIEKNPSNMGQNEPVVPPAIAHDNYPTSAPPFSQLQDPQRFISSPLPQNTLSYNVTQMNITPLLQRNLSQIHSDQGTAGVDLNIKLDTTTKSINNVKETGVPSIIRRNSAVMEEISESQIAGVVHKSSVADVNQAVPSANTTEMSDKNIAHKTGEKVTKEQEVQLFTPSEDFVTSPELCQSAESMPIGFAQPATDLQMPILPPDSKTFSQSSPSGLLPSSGSKIANVTGSLATSFHNLPSASRVLPLASATSSLPPLVSGTISFPHMDNVALPSKSNIPPQSIIVQGPPKDVPKFPPTGLLPSESAASQSTVNRTVLPPSVARKLSNTSQSILRKNPALKSDLLVPGPPSNQLYSQAQNKDRTHPTQSDTNIPQLFTPSFSTDPQVKQSTSFFSPASLVREVSSRPPLLGSQVLPSENTTILESCAQQRSQQSLKSPNPINPLSAPVHEDTPKPPLEPPKVVPGHNFRLGGRRPQYYSGPIEGNAHAMHAVKPKSEPVYCAYSEISNVAVFTPTVGQTPNQNESQYDKNPELQVATNIFHAQPPMQTAFDLSRPVLQEMYDPQKFDVQSYQEPIRDETKYGDLLGSLKSKLESVNINKLQSAVTSFFDPAYYEAERKETVRDNSSNDTCAQPGIVSNYGINRQTQGTCNFEISVQNYDSNLHIQQLNTQMSGAARDSKYRSQPQQCVGPSYGEPNSQFYGFYSQNEPLVMSENDKNQHGQCSSQTYDQNVYSFIDSDQNTPILFNPLSAPGSVCSQPKSFEINQAVHEENTAVEEYIQTSITTDIPAVFTLKGQRKRELQTIDITGNIQHISMQNQSCSFVSTTSSDSLHVATNLEECTVKLLKPHDHATSEAFMQQKPYEDLHLNLQKAVDANDTENSFIQKNNINFFGTIDTKCSVNVSTEIRPLNVSPEESKDDAGQMADNNRRNVYRHKSAENGDITTQMITNMTSPLQMFHTSEVPLIENNDNVSGYDMNVNNDLINEISQITEDTIETIQIQAANELLDREDENDIIKDADSCRIAYERYGWSVNAGELSIEPEVLNYCGLGEENDKGVKDDSLNIPRNASDEIKAELQIVSQDDEQTTHKFVPRQMSVPSAPRAEYFADLPREQVVDDRIEMIDVNLIEQDAKKDFADLLDPYIIEPSETDDDKLEKEKSEETYLFKEVISHDIKNVKVKNYLHQVDDKHSDCEHIIKAPISPIYENVLKVIGLVDDSFLETSSVDHTIPKVKSPISENILKPANPNCENVHHIISPVVSFASYFDTGNYAADNYCKSFHNPVAILNPDPMPSSTETPSVISTIKLDETQKLFLQDHAFHNSGHVMAAPTDKLISDNAKQDLTKEQDRGSIFQGDAEALASSVQASSQVDYAYQSLFNNPTPDKDIVVTDETKIKFSHSSMNTCPDLREASISNQEIKQVLADPVDFFICEDVPSNIQEPTSQPSFNLLASYFANPEEKPKKPDPKRSFFELSEGQDHYMYPSQIINIGFCQLEYLNPPLLPHLMTESSSSQVCFSDQTLNMCVNIKIPDTEEKEFKLDKNDCDTNETDQYKSMNRNLPNNSIPQIQTNILKSADTPNVFSNQTYHSINDLCNVNISDVTINNNVNYIDKTINDIYINQDENNIKSDTYDMSINDNFTSDYNGNKTEQIFIDNESHLTGIIENCERCRIHSVGGIDFTKLDLNVDMLKTSEMMDSDDKNKVSGREGEANLSTPSKATSPGLRTAVKFKDVEEENQDELDGDNDNAEEGQYRPVRYHWFYRSERDDKITWKPFSQLDSQALEDAHNSPGLSAQTVVPTDGGRYDVRVVGREREAVYWPEKPSEVRRCSWFYKGTLDARYVPYKEDIATILEREYQHGCETGSWHRRIPLPGGESVVLHGPSVMVHFLDEPGADAWSSASQATSRPRVVRRGADRTEVEQGAAGPIDHLLLLCHGIGSACDLRFRPIEEVVDEFRASCQQLIRAHYKKSYECGKVGRVEVLPVSWHSTLHTGKSGVDERLAAITLDTIPKLREFCNDTVLDVLFYTSPLYCQTIMDTVGSELERIHSVFTRRNPQFRGSVSFGGHSLGSVILFDLLCHQRTPLGAERDIMKDVKYAPGAASAGQPTVRYPQLSFQPTALYALGSPIAIFECVRGVDALGEQFRLPTCPNFFNIFHPYDPIAYRIEPLINPELKSVPPLLIPHHKGRKRMHLELKETMARVGADIRARVVDSWARTWASVWRPQPDCTTSQQDGTAVQQEDETSDDTQSVATLASEPTVTAGSREVRAGRLNAGRRVDRVLQEAPLELLNEYLSAVTGHLCYWESADTMLLILREIYDGLGVVPDVSVPQQSMTVEVVRAGPANTDERQPLYEDGPSTSKS